MNLKKAKTIRKQLRQLGVNPSQRDYDVAGGSQHHRLDGRVVVGGQVTLSAKAGRKFYKAMKQQVLA